MKKLLILSVLLLLPIFLYSTTWYVRPAGGSYGNEDGTAYADAWDGLLSVVWGGAGVVPGDTLYVCGCHVHTMSNSGNIATQGDLGIVTGSSGNIITIRGDYGGDSGAVWHGYIPTYESWNSEGSNTWSITQKGSHYDGLVFEDVGTPNYDSHTVLTQASSVQDCKDTTGSFYFDGINANDTLYVHRSDDDDPNSAGNVVVNRWGYDWKFGANIAYYTFSNIKLFSLYGSFSFQNGNNNTDIIYDTCYIWYGEAKLITPRDSCDRIDMTDCDVAYAESGYYSVSTTNDSPSGFTISGCTIHDMQTLDYHKGMADPHGIGISDGSDWTVTDNEIYDCGDGIVAYVYPAHAMANNIISFNYIHDLHANGDSGLGSCILLGASTACVPGDMTGWQIYENIVQDGSRGVAGKWPDQVEIYNNVAYDCDYSFKFGPTNNNNDAPNVKLRNNISFTPTTYHLHYDANADSGVIDSDNNDFNPIAGTQFYFRDTTGTSTVNLTDWQALSKSGCVFDPNSISDDPAFVNAGGSYDLDTDFQVASAGPTQDAGVNGIGSVDYFGNSAPSPNGGTWDIGAHEFAQSPSGNPSGLIKGVIEVKGIIVIKLEERSEYYH